MTDCRSTNFRLDLETITSYFRRNSRCFHWHHKHVCCISQQATRGHCSQDPRYLNLFFCPTFHRAILFSWLVSQGIWLNLSSGAAWDNSTRWISTIYRKYQQRQRWPHVDMQQHTRLHFFPVHWCHFPGSGRHPWSPSASIVIGTTRCGHFYYFSQHLRFHVLYLGQGGPEFISHACGCCWRIEEILQSITDALLLEFSRDANYGYYRW